MPLRHGKGHVKENIRELLTSWKKTGTINDRPIRSQFKARRVAAAIAYRIERGEK